MATGKHIPGEFINANNGGRALNYAIRYLGDSSLFAESSLGHPGPLLLFHRAVQAGCTDFTDRIVAQRALYVINDVLEANPPKTTFRRQEVEALAALPDALGGWAYKNEFLALFERELGPILEELAPRPFDEQKFIRAVETFWYAHGEHIRAWTRKYLPNDTPLPLRDSRRYMAQAMYEFEQITPRLIGTLLDEGMEQRPPIAQFKIALVSAGKYFHDQLKSGDYSREQLYELAECEDQADAALKSYISLIEPMVAPALKHWNDRPRGRC